jgi:YVTN family beta-propeller protein
VRGNDVYVIDPATLKVVDKFKVGANPQHVVPSWDLKTLWVANNAERTPNGSLTPIDPKTGKPGAPIPVDDPYNMYFLAGREVGDRRRRGVQAARLPRSAHLRAAVVAGGPALRRHQPRGFLDRRPVRDLHLRVHRRHHQGRPRRAQGDRLPAAHPAGQADQGRQGTRRQGRDDLHGVEGHAAGHPRLARTARPGTSPT